MYLRQLPLTKFAPILLRAEIARSNKSDPGQTDDFLLNERRAWATRHRHVLILSAKIPPGPQKKLLYPSSLDPTPAFPTTSPSTHPLHLPTKNRTSRARLHRAPRRGASPREGPPVHAPVDRGKKGLGETRHTFPQGTRARVLPSPPLLPSPPAPPLSPAATPKTRATVPEC